MSRILVVGILLLILNAHADWCVLHLIIHQNDTVELKEFDRKRGDLEFWCTQPQGNYQFKMLSRNYELHGYHPFQLDFASSQPPLAPLDSDCWEYYASDSEQFEKEWHIPCNEDDATIQLFHGDKKILEYPLTQDFYPLPEPMGLWWNVVQGAVIILFAAAAFLIFKIFKVFK